MMLQAYVDDSCLGEGPVGLLAGWIAPAADWARFSDDWDQALSMSPRLCYFKSSEASSLIGEVRWVEHRDDKVWSSRLPRGRNVVIDYRHVDNQYERLARLTAEFARRQVAVIAALKSRPALAARAANTTIAIVFQIPDD